MNTYLRRKLYELTFNGKIFLKPISVKNIIAALSAAKANTVPSDTAKNANYAAPVAQATPYLRYIAPGVTGTAVTPAVSALHGLVSPVRLAKTASNSLAMTEANAKLGQGVAPDVAHSSAMIHRSLAIPARGEVMRPLNVISALQVSKIIDAASVAAKAHNYGMAVAAIKAQIAKGAVCGNATTAAPLANIKPIRARGSPYAGNCELAIPTLAELKPKIAAVETAEIAADKTTTALAELKSKIAAVKTAEVATDKTVTALAMAKSSYADIAETATAHEAAIPAVSAAILKAGSSVDADTVGCVGFMENVKAAKGKGGLLRVTNSLLGFYYAGMTTRLEEYPESIDFDTDVVSNLDTYFVAGIDAMLIAI